MATLSLARIGELIEPYYGAASDALLQQLSAYLDLLVKWNGRMNLTAIRAPEEMVTRHFGESLFLASHLPPAATLLDLGSGAGFPGLPVQLARPELAVTLAESQKRKAVFLREVVRALGVGSEVWPGRAEGLPAARRFDVVTLRAVDRPAEALAAAGQRLAEGGTLALLTTLGGEEGVSFAVPGSEQRYLQLIRPQIVPRGTI